MPAQIVKVEKDSINQPLESIPLDVNVIEMTAEQIAEHGFEVPASSLK